ncbi:hypothetical protein VCHA53O466_50472 [Vibrio chagasii]|nr:hypothetical protein VCHA53O466_50472 [Vibrio chagasii]
MTLNNASPQSYTVKSEHIEGTQDLVSIGIFFETQCRDTVRKSESHFLVNFNHISIIALGNTHDIVKSFCSKNTDKSVLEFTSSELFRHNILSCAMNCGCLCSLEVMIKEMIDHSIHMIQNDRESEIVRYELNLIDANQCLSF